MMKNCYINGRMGPVREKEREEREGRGMRSRRNTRIRPLNFFMSLHSLLDFMLNFPRVCIARVCEKRLFNRFI